MSKEKYIPEGQSCTRPPFFNGKNYYFWKEKMELFPRSQDVDMWKIITDGNHIPLASNTSWSLGMNFTISNFRHPHHYTFRNFNSPNVAMRCGVATYTTIMTPNCRSMSFAMIAIFPFIRVFSVRSLKMGFFIFWIHSKSHGTFRDTL